MITFSITDNTYTVVRHIWNEIIFNHVKVAKNNANTTWPTTRHNMSGNLASSWRVANIDIAKARQHIEFNKHLPCKSLKSGTSMYTIMVTIRNNTDIKAQIALSVNVADVSIMVWLSEKHTSATSGPFSSNFAKQYLKKKDMLPILSNTLVKLVPTCLKKLLLLHLQLNCHQHLL